MSDYIALHQITQGAEGHGATTRPVFLFLPGPHLHGEIVFPDERYDLRLYLAQRGIDTWALDYRTHFVPREQISDSSFMQAWTTAAFVEDVTAAVHFIHDTTGAPKLFVGGSARGATFAYLYAARHWREDLLGLVIFDGYALNPPDTSSLYHERSPTLQWFADDLEGRYLPYKRWMKILQDTRTDPSGKDLLEETDDPDFLGMALFASRAEFLAHGLYVNVLPGWGEFGTQGGLSNAKDGYADVTILAQVLQHQDRYWPRVQNHGGFDLHRHLADAAIEYETALRAINVPILTFANGNSGAEWEERVAYTARSTATQDVQEHVLRHWGHLDLLWGNFAAREVFQPVCDWLTYHSLLVSARGRQ